jgi:hypothetical protein
MYRPHSGQEDAMARYGKTSSRTVARSMRRRKKGTLKTGTGKKVTSRRQAVAIGLSEARAKGAKVPRRKSGARRQTMASRSRTTPQRRKAA